MRNLERTLSLTSPFMRGADVLNAQRGLRSFGFVQVEPDGLFGKATWTAVREFQSRRGLAPTGEIDSRTWGELFAAQAPADGQQDLATLTKLLSRPHQFRDSVPWCLTARGIAVNNQSPVGTPGSPITVGKIIGEYGALIETACAQHGVPFELIVATIATESQANQRARRQEPCWVSDEATPQCVSVGLMQTLISTARQALRRPTVSAADLEDPAISIDAGVAYIASQFATTQYDPPKVACAYNAGGLYYNPSPSNRWKMRQYPIGTSKHADRFVSFFNDCFSVLREQPRLPKAPSFTEHWGKN